MTITPHPAIQQSEPDYPEIIPFDGAEVPDYQPGMLPAVLEDWAADVSECMDYTPIDMAAACAVIVAGTAIGRHCAIQPKQAVTTYRRYPLLWGMLVSPSGIKKTPVLDQMAAPLFEYERDHSELVDPRWSEWSARVRAARLDMAAAEKRYQAARASNDEEGVQAALAEMADAEVRANEPEPIDRLIVKDSTYEALEDIMARTHRGLLLKMDETAQFLKRLEQDRNAAERQFYLWSWQPGSPYIIDRKTRRARPGEGGLAVLGAAQPDALRRLIQGINAGGASNDGLLQRFQVMVMPRMERGAYVDRPINEVARGQYERAIRDLLKYDWADPDRRQPHVFTFDELAQSRFRQWSNRNMQAVHSEQTGSAFASHLAKYDTLISALALIFELVENPIAEQVGLESFNRAERYTEYLRGHAEAIYGIGQPMHVQDAISLLTRFQKGKWPDRLAQAFNARDAQQARLLGRNGIRSERYQAAINELATRGYLIPIHNGRAFAWNPALTQQDAS